MRAQRQFRSWLTNSGWNIPAPFIMSSIAATAGNPFFRTTPTAGLFGRLSPKPAPRPNGRSTQLWGIAQAALAAGGLAASGPPAGRNAHPQGQRGRARAVGAEDGRAPTTRRARGFEGVASGLVFWRGTLSEGTARTEERKDRRASRRRRTDRKPAKPKPNASWRRKWRDAGGARPNWSSAAKPTRRKSRWRGACVRRPRPACRQGGDAGVGLPNGW